MLGSWQPVRILHCPWTSFRHRTAASGGSLRCKTQKCSATRRTMCELRLEPRIRAAKKNPSFILRLVSKNSFFFSLNLSTLGLEIISMEKKLEGADVTHQNPPNSCTLSPYDGSCEKERRGRERKETNISQSCREEVESLQSSEMKSFFHHLSKKIKHWEVTHSAILCDFCMSKPLKRDSLGVFSDQELTPQLGQLPELPDFRLATSVIQEKTM